jgi:hypothetical protein
MLLHINGTEYADYDNLDTNPTIVANQISIERVGDNQLALATEDDHSIVVTREPNNLVVVVTLDESLFGSTMGLLGNWSNTMEDDFTLRNGTSLGYPLTDEQIHFDFGENCKYLSIHYGVSREFPGLAAGGIIDPLILKAGFTL